MTRSGYLAQLADADLAAAPDPGDRTSGGLRLDGLRDAHETRRLDATALLVHASRRRMRPSTSGRSASRPTRSGHVLDCDGSATAAPAAAELTSRGRDRPMARSWWRRASPSRDWRSRRAAAADPRSQRSTSHRRIYVYTAAAERNRSARMASVTDDFRHRTTLQVRFRDIDAFGHVNNAVFFSYVELARIRYLLDVLQPDEPLRSPAADPGARRARLPLPDRLRRGGRRSRRRVDRIGRTSFAMSHRMTAGARRPARRRRADRPGHLRLRRRRARCRCPTTGAHASARTRAVVRDRCAAAGARRGELNAPQETDGRPATLRPAHPRRRHELRGRHPRRAARPDRSGSSSATGSAARA